MDLSLGPGSLAGLEPLTLGRISPAHRGPDDLAGDPHGSELSEQLESAGAGLVAAPHLYPLRLGVVTAGG